jgi:hypothetical protein
MTKNNYWISGYDLTKYSPLEIFQPVVEYGADTLIINHAFEGHPYPQLGNIKELCDQKDIRIICILGGTGTGIDVELAKNNYPGVEFVYWPTYWMFFATMCQGSQNYLLEQRPHSVLLGMMVAGYIMGADTGVLYIRAEYPEAISITQMK